MKRKWKMSKRRAAWCNEYERLTTFEPLMDDFEDGNESWAEAVKRSLDWFYDWQNEVRTQMPEAPK